MTSDWIRRRVALSVAQRLVLGLLPSLLAVALVVALAYWGQYAHTAPVPIVSIAGVLAVISLGVTWVNARYLTARITRLAGPADARPTTESGDELDRIEQVVDRLGGALTASESERIRSSEAAATRLHEQATMLAATVRDTITRLDEVRLPLHILLDAKFGDLNENQEELLRDARSAADAIDDALRRLGQIADADRGALAVQREFVQVNDVVRGVLPLARAAAERRGARVDATLEPGLSRVSADRVRLAEALTLLFQAAAESVEPERPLAVTTARDQRRVVVAISPPPNGSDVMLARRLVEAQGGSIEQTPDAINVRLG